eukprot:GHVQ01015949.1.p1 GENE.GHVQ01015949.1~~GHVQ01015949.1.p1  ORF type:complete len:360 (+),score=58.62 GHVQ01015949.1:283-1362(+)
MVSSGDASGLEGVNKSLLQTQTKIGFIPSQWLKRLAANRFLINISLTQWVVFSVASVFVLTWVICWFMFVRRPPAPKKREKKNSKVNLSDLNGNDISQPQGDEVDSHEKTSEDKTSEDDPADTGEQKPWEVDSAVDDGSSSIPVDNDPGRSDTTVLLNKEAEDGMDEMDGLTDHSLGEAAKAGRSDTTVLLNKEAEDGMDEMDGLTDHSLGEAAKAGRSDTTAHLIEVADEMDGLPDPSEAAEGWEQHTGCQHVFNITERQKALPESENVDPLGGGLTQSHADISNGRAQAARAGNRIFLSAGGRQQEYDMAGGPMEYASGSGCSEVEPDDEYQSAESHFSVSTNSGELEGLEVPPVQG